MVTKELLKYIKKYKKQKIPDELIKNTLKDADWPNEDIDKALGILQGRSFLLIGIRYLLLAILIILAVIAVLLSGDEINTFITKIF
jgi:hypothetical protein